MQTQQQASPVGLCAQACSSTALPAGALLRKSHLQVGGQPSEKSAGQLDPAATAIVQRAPCRALRNAHAGRCETLSLTCVQSPAPASPACSMGTARSPRARPAKC